MFTADGRVVGITSVLDQEEESWLGESRVVPIEDACQVLGAAEKTMRGAAPPNGTLLPVEPARPFPLDALEDAAQRRGGVGPYQMSSSDFDIGFITPTLAYAAQRRWKEASGGEAGPDARSQDAAQERRRLLTDFGSWSEYVAEVPPVLLVRVTPKLVEGFWTKVARGAAYTQGVALPPMKHFKPGFSRMRAFCGTSEVTPIHAFTLEQRVSETDAILEGRLHAPRDVLVASLHGRIGGKERDHMQIHNGPVHAEDLTSLRPRLAYLDSCNLGVSRVFISRFRTAGTVYYVAPIVSNEAGDSSTRTMTMFFEQLATGIAPEVALFKTRRELWRLYRERDLGRRLWRAFPFRMYRLN